MHHGPARLAPPHDVAAVRGESVNVQDGRCRATSAGWFLGILLAALASDCGKDNPSQPKVPPPIRSLAFSARPPISVGNTWSTIAAGDFDHDGHSDLVTTSVDSPIVYLLLGKADGSFRAPALLPIPARAGLAVDAVAGDWDHDGISDVACNCYYATVFLYGREDGSFDSTLIDERSPVVQGSASVGDFNGDGIDDYASFNWDSWVVIAGDSGRMPKRIVSYTPPVIGWNPTFGTSADLDGDGTLDLALTRGVSKDHASIYYGYGDGRFRFPTPLSDAGGNYGICTISRKGGGPGRDLVMAHVVVDSVGVIPRIGGIIADEVIYHVSGSPCGLASADFDLDGIEDLVVACTNARSVAVLLGREDGTFAQANYFYVGIYPSRLTVADLNGDGLPDVATIGNEEICVLINSSE
ncbi:MAG TPA: VCBS repeat-containing protein [Candidatus Eisenbacteria bacterium]|nr:VCBS repeat-containing protein [Candidatus Eisenbacteria bacterium]